MGFDEPRIVEGVRDSGLLGRGVEPGQAEIVAEMPPGLLGDSSGLAELKIAVGGQDGICMSSFRPYPAS
jgi:hypothetical protein